MRTQCVFIYGVVFTKFVGVTGSECLFDSLDDSSRVNGFVFEFDGVAGFPNSMSCDCVCEYEQVCKGDGRVREVEFYAEFV